MEVAGEIAGLGFSCRGLTNRGCPISGPVSARCGPNGSQTGSSRHNRHSHASIRQFPISRQNQARYGAPLVRGKETFQVCGRR
jgi:hypothetical protein